MHIYLIRHAHATDGDNDAARPLSKKGLAQIRAVGGWLRQAKAIDAKEVWHSPLVRSHETAVRLTKRLRLDAKLCGVSALRPDDEPNVIARRLDNLREPIMLVGHEPHLSALATLLVIGKATAPRFHFKKCSVLRLDRAGEHWSVRWHLSPEVVK
jgi:phosphohistidine phosphatase